MDFYGNINLRQNKMQEMVFQTETQFPTVPLVGRVVFKEQQLYMCVAINNTIPVWLPLTNRIDTYIHDQAATSQTWTITHNLNTVNPILQIYDAAGLMIIPNNVVPISNNVISVTLSTAIAGTAVVLFGNLLPDSGIGLLEAVGWPTSINSSTFDSVDESIGADTFGLSISDDGLNLYVARRLPSPQESHILQYTMSTANDLSTASLTTDKQLTEANGISSVYVSPNGTKMYMIDDFSDTIFQYTLSTPYAVSSSSYDSVSFNASFGNPEGIHMNAAGTRMFTSGDASEAIRQINLSTPFDLSTAANEFALSITSVDTNPGGVFLNPNGDKLYVVGNQNDAIFTYTLATAFELNTATLDAGSFSVTSQDTNPEDVVFSADGTKMFMAGITNDKVYQYTVG